MPRHAHRQGGTAGRAGRRGRALLRPVPPASEPRATVVVLHGANSCKESHFDFARACRADGLAAVSFDMRGHGESEGALDERAIADVATIAALARDRTGVGAIALRGSSMGGYLALVAAAGAGARAVVAICPASGAGLARGLRDGRFTFRADAARLGAVLAEHDELRAAEQLDIRCCSCTPRAMRSSPSSTPARSTSPRPARASSPSRAATTARCSTTRSCRRWRCASCATPCASAGASCGRGRPTS